MIKDVIFKTIERVLPFIMTRMNDILKPIMNTTIRFVIDSSTTINDNVNYSIKFLVNDNKGDRLLRMLSGSEKFFYSIAFRIAVSTIIQRATTNFIIIDEGWGNLDENNSNYISHFFQLFKEYFTIAIIVSHSIYAKNIVDKQLIINIRDEYSKINY